MFATAIINARKLKIKAMVRKAHHVALKLKLGMP